jgi:hypothetical protein
VGCRIKKCLYPNKLKNWPIGGFKAPNFNDRKRHSIALILCRLRSLKFVSFQSRLSANFSVYLGICVLGLALRVFQVHADEGELAFLKTQPKTNMKNAQKQPIQQSCEKVAGVRQENDRTTDAQERSRLQIGGNYTRAHIRIIGQPSFNGNLGGAQGLYEFRPLNNFYAGLSINWKQGKTKSAWANRKLIYVDVQERLGYTYATRCKNWTASLFTGFGYRHLGHKLEQSGTHIKFEYNELYVPLGIASDYLFNAWFAGGLNFIWMPQVYPTVKIIPLKGARWILRSSINNFLVEIPITFTLPHSRQFSLILKPFYEYWQDGKSTAKSPSGLSLGLPGNTYNFWGAELNFAYSF